MSSPNRRGIVATCWLALVFPSVPAAADDRAAPELTRDGTSFWEWLEAPHATETAVILAKAGENIARANTDYQLWDYNGALNTSRQNNRDRLLDDAIGMLHYGLGLDADNPELARMLGTAAEERGDMELARSALERYLESEVPSKISAAARVRLGRVYARLERWNDAVVQLRLALGDARSDAGLQSQATVTLACVFMQQGRMAQAIDLLEHVTNAGPQAYYGGYLVYFTLGVAYDRDEQLTLAHRALEKIVGGNQYQNLAGVLFDTQNARITFTPPIDRYYFSALQLEAMGELPEARADWLAYIRAGARARFRERARQHVRAIDAELQTRTERPADRKARGGRP